MSAVAEQKKLIKGGAFLIEERTPEEIFTPEDFTEEHRMIADTTVGDLLPVRFATVSAFEPAAGAQFLVRHSDVEKCSGFDAPAPKRKR